MIIGIPKEHNDTRVAATPFTIKQLKTLGFDVMIERGAGLLANFNDSSFSEEGAEIADKDIIWSSDIILKVNPPSTEEIRLLKNNSILIGFIWPSQNSELLSKLINKKTTVIAMDTVPRISRAQSLDALSSMSNIAGYRAVIEAAHEFGSFFSGQITAAGKILPAKVMIIGAGVSGLTAIGTACSLGAVVFAFDTRPEVEEQIRSMGAEFLKLNIDNPSPSNDVNEKIIDEDLINAERKLFATQAPKVDIIITTALITGKPAPILLTKKMITSMKEGSIIVDLAAINGGNCELTVADKVISSENGVKIIGYTNLPNRMPTLSSKLYSTNLLNLLKLLCKEKNGKIVIDFLDPIIRSVTIINNGDLTWPAPPISPPISPYTSITKENIKDKIIIKEKKFGFLLYIKKYFFYIVFIILITWLANITPPEFLSHFSVFTLACIVGYYVVWNVNHALHTPLMSVTNAISGIIVIGAILQMKCKGVISFLSFVAILLSSINIFGGFTVTQRMLKMFRK